MKRLIALTGMTLALAAAVPAAVAQSAPPPLPAMTPQQSSDVQQRIDRYRTETNARVARGEITPDEANRLVQWREWQFARQITLAPRFVDRRAPMDYDARPGGPVPPDYSPRPDASVPPDSSPRPDASVPPDSSPRPDASVPPDYSPQSDASVPPDYSPRSDASMPPDYYGPPSDYYNAQPVPYYGPYYGPYYRYATPYYWGPRPYAYWGPSVCAGGFGRHFGGRICF